jgi:hypothetical protein
MTDTPAVAPPLSRRDLVRPLHVWSGPTWEIRARHGEAISLILNGAADSTLRALTARGLLGALGEAVAIAEGEAQAEHGEAS